MSGTKEKPSIIVSRECPLIVSGTGDCREYNYVVLEKGAYIRILDGSKFSVETLTREIPESGIRIFEAESQPYEQDDIYNGFDIIIAGRDGAKGDNGGDGGDGGQGGNGGWGAPGGNGLPLNQDFDLIVNNLQFDLNVYYGGGKGGQGGNGGNGGKSSREGAVGGYGGDGGIGGDGGDQSDFTLTVTCSGASESAYVCKVTNAVSPGGKGGQGGIGGTPNPASGSTNGSRGTDGSSGGKGTVILNGKEVE